MIDNKWEVLIGFETHIKLLTNSKIFSNSSTKFNCIQNTNISPFDLALPGTLPCINKNVVYQAIKFGLATNSNIMNKSIFVRKKYFYPDLPKGYQISQYKDPILLGGKICINVLCKNNIKLNYKKNINLKQSHLEEDSGRLLHCFNNTYIDFNRSGIPLLEVVTKPEIYNVSEALSYIKTLHRLVVWLKICDGIMENGSFRCDANISIRLLNQKKMGVRVEIKNLNSFKFICNSIKYEINRQINLLEGYGRVIHETRLYDSKLKKTISMREKEYSFEYCYFSDPDLVPLIIENSLIKKIEKKMPILPYIIENDLINIHKLSFLESSIILSDKVIYNFYIEIINNVGITFARRILIWINYIIHELNIRKINIKYSPILPLHVIHILKCFRNKIISNKIVKDIFISILKKRIINILDIDNLINNLRKKNIDFDKLQLIIKKVLDKNIFLAKDFKIGKYKVCNSLIGKVIKSINCSINPIDIDVLLKIELFKIMRYIF